MKRTDWLQNRQPRLYTTFAHQRHRRATFERKLRRAERAHERGYAFEPLEQRTMLAADLSYATADDLRDLTLTFDTGSNSFRLVDTNDTDEIVSSASKADATDGGIRITGTTNDDLLRLDVTKLSSAGPTASITFARAGDDVMTVTANENSTLTDSTLTLATTTFNAESNYSASPDG